MSRPMLQMQGVHTHIGAYHILHGVDLTVPAGQLTLLLGRNGAGKTTTLRTLMGLWRASAGQVFYQGHDITCMPTPDIARLGIAYVPEDRRRHGVVLEMPIAHNMTMAIHRRLFTGSWLRFGAERSLALEFMGFAGPDVNEGVASLRERRAPQFGSGGF